MSAQLQPTLPFTRQRIAAHRESKRVKVERLFVENLGRSFSSRYLHDIFGSSVRTRISEINRDAAALITIRNSTGWDEATKTETSVYWSALR